MDKHQYKYEKERFQVRGKLSFCDKNIEFLSVIILFYIKIFQIVLCYYGIFLRYTVKGNNSSYFAAGQSATHFNYM